MMIVIHYYAQVYKNESVFGTIIGTKRYYTHNIVAEKNILSTHKTFPHTFPRLPNNNHVTYTLLGPMQTYIHSSTEHITASNTCNDLQLSASY